MTRELVYAFTQLRVSERHNVLRELNVNFSQGVGESSLDYSKRLLREIEKAGKVRDLEDAMRAYQ